MKMLLDLAPDEVVLKRLREWDQPGGVPDEMFQLRTGDKMHWGPYGHLVRELHFHTSENGLHDYLWLPELVEDVCKAYQKKYGHDLNRIISACFIPVLSGSRRILFMKKGFLKRLWHMPIHQSVTSRRTETQLSA